ncbi:hypothetical protein GQX74_005924 [Glossina fuscipes]|nr:hypothetical protein GQX74_005924 [Glossina fuscipes]
MIDVSSNQFRVDPKCAERKDSLPPVLPILTDQRTFGLRRATELFSDAVQFIDRHFRLYFESQSQENDCNQFKVRSETITKATDDEENEIHMYDNLGVHLIFIAHCLVVFENLEHEYNVR